MAAGLGTNARNLVLPTFGEFVLLFFLAPLFYYCHYNLWILLPFRDMSNPNHSGFR